MNGHAVGDESRKVVRNFAGQDRPKGRTRKDHDVGAVKVEDAERSIATCGPLQIAAVAAFVISEVDVWYTEHGLNQFHGPVGMR